MAPSTVSEYPRRMKIGVIVHFGEGNAQKLKMPPGLESDLTEFRQRALQNAIVQFRNIERVELLSDDHTVREDWRPTESGWVPEK